MISVPRTVHGAPQRRQAALGSKPRGHDHAQPRARCGPLHPSVTRCNTLQRVATRLHRNALQRSTLPRTMRPPAQSSTW